MFEESKVYGQKYILILAIFICAGRQELVGNTGTCRPSRRRLPFSPAFTNRQGMRPYVLSLVRKPLFKLKDVSQF